jgi:hypothetical protein
VFPVLEGSMLDHCSITGAADRFYGTLDG